MSDVESEIDRYTKMYKAANLIPLLHLTHFSYLLPQSVPGSERKCILVPLCWKAVNIGHLLHEGFRVLGIEAVLQAIQKVGTENKLQLDYDEEESVYSTPDKRVIIFHGDIFKCPIEKWGPVDGVLDAGAFSIFPQSRRPEYMQVIRRALKGTRNFRYLLTVCDYDKSLSTEPAWATTREDIETYFGSWCRIYELKSIPVDSSTLFDYPFLEKGTACRQVIYNFGPL